MREAAEEEACGERIAEEELHSSYFPSISQPLIDPASKIHLTPQPLELPRELGPIASVACGSQHTVLLSRAGRLFSFRRSLEGQLGIGTRTSTKVPTLVTTFQNYCVLAVATGTDFTMALTNFGTVFGWDSNTSGQLGKPPVDVGGKGENNKVLMMKTTQHVIRLQHGLQNSLGVPNPVQGLTETGVYSEVVLTVPRLPLPTSIPVFIEGTPSHLLSRSSTVSSCRHSSIQLLRSSLMSWILVSLSYSF